MRKIDIEESQSLLLTMAKTVNGIAAKHSIPFFMIGGTMLGAIRHKGFIPWDDDMDFGTTYSYFWRFADVLEKELSKRYRVITYENCSKHYHFFFKVEDTFTLIDDKSLNLPMEKKIGLSIDVFPMVSCTEEGILDKRDKVRNMYLKIRRSYIKSTENTWYKSITKFFIRITMRQKPIDLLRETRTVIESVQPGDKYCNITSPRYWKNIWDATIFDELSDYTFEGKTFKGSKDYDTFLKGQYKDYMKLPSKKKQIVHGGNIYMR